MTEDIWQHAERHLRVQRDKLALELQRVDAEIAMLSTIRLHEGLRHVTSSQVELWLARYVRARKTKREKLPSWVTDEARQNISKQQRKRHLHEHEGEKLSLKAWADRYGMNPVTLQKRVKGGMTLAEALEAPVAKGRRS